MPARPGASALTLVHHRHQQGPAAASPRCQQIQHPAALPARQGHKATGCCKATRLGTRRLADGSRRCLSMEFRSCAVAGRSGPRLDHHAPAQYPFVNHPALRRRNSRLVVAMVAIQIGGKARPVQQYGLADAADPARLGNGRAIRRGVAQYVQPATRVLHPDYPANPSPIAVASRFKASALPAETVCRAQRLAVHQHTLAPNRQRAIGQPQAEQQNGQSPAAPAPQHHRQGINVPRCRSGVKAGPRSNNGMPGQQGTNAAVVGRNG